MCNLIFYISTACFVVLWIIFTGLDSKSSYKKYLIKCYKLHIRPFNIFQYYFYKLKGDL